MLNFRQLWVWSRWDFWSWAWSEAAIDSATKGGHTTTWWVQVHRSLSSLERKWDLHQASNNWVEWVCQAQTLAKVWRNSNAYCESERDQLMTTLVTTQPSNKRTHIGSVKHCIALDDLELFRPAINNLPCILLIILTMGAILKTFDQKQPKQ